MLSMVADHLRYLWPSAQGLFVIGRLAFPLFCLVIACHVARSRAGELYTSSNARHLTWMLAFSVLSEWPYHLLDGDSATFSVMPTLTLGLLCAWGVHHPQLLARVAGLSAGVVAAGAHQHLMYGLPGVLLPSACLLSWRRPGCGLVLSGCLAVVANLTNGWLASHLTQPITWLVMASAFLAIPLGWRMVDVRGITVLPVGRWAYGFYPLHLLAIKSLLMMSAAGHG
ncbi:conjugal transfer protein TraX [Pseudomonas sp. S75]|nr:conjugal transfer protein TraX [Pseudomonas sp. S30]MBK0152943.1 conjugal transfer protein TraX [Pseudomonas sp. S75]